ncbi:MAG TPA: hypothetical protein VLJ37_08900 [bacterium]|nr:hypothetical protein [bacterium]
MTGLCSLIQRIPASGAILDAASLLEGARLFHVTSGAENLWLADLARFDPPLGGSLFLSADGRIFHQLRVVERHGACVLTDTPGIVPALAVYQENDVQFFWNLPGRPLEMRRVLLERIPTVGLLRGASFFAFLGPPEPQGPGVRNAVLELTPDRLIRKMERRISDFDHGRLTIDAPYLLGRGLKECSGFSRATPFGGIEEKVRERLSSAAPDRSQPLRILTIGPGYGRMEAELKALFGERVAIDTFSLTDVIPPENRPAFSSVYLGNLDTHRLPQGYDLALSFFGSSHAVDQRRVWEQIVDSLVPGGEAFFVESRDLFLGFVSETPRGDEIRYLRENHSLLHRSMSDPMTALVSGICVEMIFIRKERPCPPAKAMLDEAAGAAKRYQGLSYSREAGVAAGPLSDEANFGKDLWETFLEAARFRGYALDPRASAEDVAAFKERLLKKCRYKSWEATKDNVSLTTLGEAVEIVWEWILWQEILVKR